MRAKLNVSKNDKSQLSDKMQITKGRQFKYVLNACKYFHKKNLYKNVYMHQQPRLCSYRYKK